MILAWKRFVGLTQNTFHSMAGTMPITPRCLGRRRHPAVARLLPVERLEDRQLLTTFTVTTPADSGEGSLRDAITQANLDNTLDTIEFDIVNLSGSFIKTIALESDLPEIYTPIHFDGTTMPTYTNAPLVVLDGSAVVSGTQMGLTFASGSEGSVVEGLTINRFGSYGIRIGANDITVRANYLGTDETGTSDQGNAAGIGITGNNFTIGGTTAAERNIISGNTYDGIEILGGSNGFVEGNYIGTDVTGSFAIPNSKGISNYNGSHDNLIGGTTAGSGNVISGNTSVGIHLFGSGYPATVQGNLIGLSANGMNPLPNHGYGIVIGSSNNLIGGPTSDAANIIAHNDTAGIGVENGTGNRFQRNSIFQNGTLGIDLNTNNLTLNDLHDADSGANDLLNYPVITAATTIEGYVYLIGDYSGPANETLVLEFFSNEDQEPSGYGEGAHFLGEAIVTTDGNGHASFDVTLPITTGTWITATATDSHNNTSEFSAQAFASHTIINLSNSPLTVKRNKTVLIDPQATVTTTRSNFDFTKLNIGVSSGAQPLDSLQIKNFTDEQSHAKVKYDARKHQLLSGRTIIANLYSPDDMLQLAFRSGISTSLLQQIIRHITFRSSKDAGTRDVSLQVISAEDPPLSAVSTRTIPVT